MKLKSLLLPLTLLALVFTFAFTATNKLTKPLAPSPQIEQLKYIDVPLTINYKQQDKPVERKIATVKENSTAWEALKKVVGEQNIQFKDYGADLGIFINAINGVAPSGNKFWLFKINGEGAKVGVSSYRLKQSDQIEFEISEPDPSQ